MIDSKALEVIHYGERIATFPASSIEATILLQPYRVNSCIDVFQLENGFAIISKDLDREIRSLLPSFVKTKVDFNHFISSLKIAYLAGVTTRSRIRSPNTEIH